MDDFELPPDPGPAPQGPGAAPLAPRGPVGPLIAAGVVLGGFGLLATVATAAAVAGLGLWIALAAAALPGLVLPAALFVRALLIGRKRRLPPIVRLLLASGITLLLQVALIIGAFELAGRTMGDVAAVAEAALEESVGELPLISRVLKKLASGGDRTLPDPRHPFAMPSSSPQPAATADGGTVAGDGGAPSGSDVAVDGGAAVAAVADAGGLDSADAGVAVGTGEPAMTDAVLRVASLGKVAGGKHVAIVTSLDAAGVASHRLYPLAPFADQGNPRTADVNAAGDLAVLMGTAQVVRLRDGELEAVSSLTRGKRFEAQSIHGDDIEVELRSIDDLRVLKGGTLLVTGSVMFDDGERPQLLAAVVAWQPGREGPVLVRRQGDLVRGSENGRARRFELRDPSPFGAFAVVEHFTDKGVDVPTNTSGTTWKMNPQRLLVGHADAPEALAEVARTGVSAAGDTDRTLQAFLDVAFAGDDRLIVDSNSQQKGRDGALVVVQVDGSVTKVPTRASLFAKGAPRVRWLSVEPEGNLAFIDKGGALVRGNVDAPGELKAVLRQSKVEGPEGKPVRVSDPKRPRIARGGGWVIVDVAVGKKRGLVAQSADTDRLILQAGDTVPSVGGDVVVEQLDLAGADRHPLWPR